MTAETDLLPLPEKWTAYSCMSQSEMMDLLHDHARACVSSATEALRAEVERLKELVRSVGHETLTRAEQAEARAERLAEALRMFLQAGVGNSTDFYVQYYATLAARAALDQETTNG